MRRVIFEMQGISSVELDLGQIETFFFTLGFGASSVETSAKEVCCYGLIFPKQESSRGAVAELWRRRNGVLWLGNVAWTARGGVLAVFKHDVVSMSHHELLQPRLNLRHVPER